MNILNKAQGILVRLFCAWCAGGVFATLLLEPSGAGSAGAWAVIAVMAVIGWILGARAAECLEGV